ncbi:MAG: sugar ABC transporter permease [Lentisphaerae bacterium]|nr:sugar ABC transporter permease [Lentisphaerota bacterium]
MGTDVNSTGLLRRREERLAWAFLAAPLLVLLGLVLYPVIYSVWISFHHVTIGSLRGKWAWAGLTNFRLLFADRQFFPALATTLVYAVSASILSVGMGLAAALALNRPFPGRALTRGLLLFPFVAPVIAVAFVWRWLLDTDGVVNWALCGMGLLEQPVAFLSERGWALAWVILFEGWRYSPFAMLLILARLQAIPEPYYEAAELDGAGPWQKFRYITLPQVGYVLGVLFLLRLMWTFNKFDDIYLLTSGAAGTKVLPILVYELSFGSLQFGLGAAAAMVLFGVLFLLILFYVRKVLKW